MSSKGIFTEIYAWGNDNYGQLGLCSENEEKTTEKQTIPFLCCFNVVITSVACGEEHSAFITDEGNVYTMGSNLEGRLGIGNKQLRSVNMPCLVEILVGKKAKKIACGWGHTAAILDDGDLVTWGYGGDGQLGLGTTASEYSPQLVKAVQESRIVDVDCGSRHTAVITFFGEILMFGNGEYGQLGTGKRDKELYPVQIFNGVDANFVQIACGQSHSLFLSKTGAVWATGHNLLGQLGLGHKKNCLTPVKVSSGLENIQIDKIRAGYHSAGISVNGELYIWGTGIFGEMLIPTLVPSLQGRKVLDCDIGSTFSIVIVENQGVYGWGSNNNGELGLGDFNPRAEPSLIESLKENRICSLSCGGNFAIALGGLSGAISTSNATNENGVGNDIGLPPIEKSEQTQGNQAESQGDIGPTSPISNKMEKSFETDNKTAVSILSKFRSQAVGPHLNYSNDEPATQIHQGKVAAIPHTEPPRQDQQTTSGICDKSEMKLMKETLFRMQQEMEDLRKIKQQNDITARKMEEIAITSRKFEERVREMSAILKSHENENNIYRDENARLRQRINELEHIVELRDNEIWSLKQDLREFSGKSDRQNTLGYTNDSISGISPGVVKHSTHRSRMKEYSHNSQRPSFSGTENIYSVVSTGQIGKAGQHITAGRAITPTRTPLEREISNQSEHMSKPQIKTQTIITRPLSPIGNHYGSKSPIGEPKEEICENIKQIKEKLGDLQRNKNALEQRMQDFEKRLKDSRKVNQPY